MSVGRQKNICRTNIGRALASEIYYELPLRICFHVQQIYVKNKLTFTEGDYRLPRPPFDVNMFFLSEDPSPLAT